MEILPVTRKERFLKAAMDSEPLTIDAVTRIETYLSKISGADVTIPDPVTKIEMYLASIAGADVVLPDPVTRVEKYLAKLAGMDVLVPEPITRIEQFLSDWVNQPVGVLKTISGAVVFVSDALARAAEDVSVEINPIQDLHGYSNPWPAGGGKNLLDKTAITQYSSWSASEYGGSYGSNNVNRTFTIPTTAGQTYTLTVKTTDHSSVPQYISFCKSNLSKDTTSIIERFTTDSWQKDSYTFTAEADTYYYLRMGSTGTEANFTTQIGKISYFQLELGPTATDYAPYSNICPITGWTEAKVWRTGKNLLDSTLADIVVGTILGTTGQNSSSTNRLRTNGYIPIKPDVTYITSYAGNIGKSFCHYYDANKTYLGNSGWVNQGASFTAPSKVAFVRIVFGKSNDGTVSVDDIANVQLELGSTASAYEPYTGTTYFIDWTDEAGTVYGGELDVTTGVLTVNMVGVDMGSLTWTETAKEDYQDFRSSGVSASIKVVNSKTKPNMLCSMFATLSREDQELGATNAIGITASGNVVVYVPLNSYADKNAFKAAMSGVQLVYELATPLTIQLTPTEIEMLEGNNTLWADTGDITVTYMADGPADDVEALNILLGNRYVNLGEQDEATDREALDILLGGRQ